MSDRTLRARAVLDEWFGVAVVVALVVALAGGYLAYGAYAQDHTKTETRTVASWESVGSFDHRATVVNGSGPFEEGTVLVNRTAYFTSVTPRLNGSFAYSYTASGGGNLTADAELTVVIRSVSEGDREGQTTEYWRVEDPVSNASIPSLGPGESLSLSFSRNVTALQQRAASIEENLSTPGTTEVFFRARVDLSGTRNGAPVDRVRTYRLPITYESGVYRVQDPGPMTNSDTTRERVTVAADPGTLAAYGGPLLLLVGLVAAVGLPVARRQEVLEPSDAEREYLAYRAHRSEFEEWIHAVELPDAAFERPEARADSLGDLVDLAIDVDAAVHEAPDDDAYYVVHDGMLYSYRVPDPAGEDGDAVEDPSQQTLGEAASGIGGEAVSVDGAKADDDPVEGFEAASGVEPDGDDG